MNIVPLAMLDDLLAISPCGWESNDHCPDLQVHGEKIQTVATDVYLGDVISGMGQTN